MAADWNHPALTDPYANILTYLMARDLDAATQFVGSTSTNIPTGAIRWNPATYRWETYSGSSWSAWSTQLAVGTVTLGADPTSALQASTKQYVDNSVSHYMPLAGGTFTGNVALTGNMTISGTLSIGGVAVATQTYVTGLAATATPVMDGTGAVGVSTNYARQDHVHPSDTSRAPLASPAFTGAPTFTNTAIGGIELKLVGDGSTTPNKYIQVTGGVFKILNSAGTAAIASWTDAGAMTIPSSLAVSGNESVAGTLTVTGAISTPSTVTATGNIIGAAATAVYHAPQWGQVFAGNAGVNNVAGARALGTTYTNSTGKPIAVLASVYSSAAYTTAGYVNGAFAAGSGNSSPSYLSLIVLIVPPGATYSVTVTGGSGTIYAWIEVY